MARPGLAGAGRTARRQAHDLRDDARTVAILIRSEPTLVRDAIRLRRLSRGVFAGWAAENPNRRWEYPWVYRRVAAVGGGEGRRAVDFGAGKSPIPIAISRLGYSTAVVDPDSEPVLGRKYGNEWDYVDYSKWGITTYQRGMEESIFEPETVDVAISVSVIEHLAAAIRRKAIAEVSRVVRPLGTVVFTVDVLNDSNDLWNRVIDEVEPIAVHGRVDTVISEAADNGLEIIDLARCPISSGDSGVVGMVFRKA